jgi:serine/threonine-protein kinase
MASPEPDPPRLPVADRPTLPPRDPARELSLGDESALGMLTADEFGAPSLDPEVGTQGSACDEAEMRNTQVYPAAPGDSRSPLITPSPYPPADFGPYELIEEIGRGGMGVVYKAHQRQLDRMVAVKMILGSHLANPEQVARFYAEARAAARLQDPRVVAIHDVGQIHGQHFFAMEYMPGPSLAQMVRSGPIDPEVAARYVMEVARAVGRLHRRGVVHRDLKPSNILLDAQGQPCVTDFGLAKMLSSDGPSTRTGAIVGTPSYMAPEQAAGRSQDVGPLSDLYSLGAILYELITGSPPFEAPNPLDTLVQVIESEPTPPSRVRPELPKPLETICLKCLEKSPSARYGTADALADDLQRYLKAESIEARQLRLSQRVRRWARREPALVARLVTLGACGLFTQVDQLAFQRLDPSFNRGLMIVISLGLVASLIFQGLLKRERWTTVARYAWSTADMILFSSVLLFAYALQTPLVAGYVLLISASGLWFRERTVWFTTFLAVVSYCSLYTFDLMGVRNIPRPIEALLFLLGLVLTGFVVSYQVKRVRALSAYYEKRQLP